MNIHKIKKNAIPKIAVLATGLAVAIIAATVGPMPAQADPGRAANCAGCHSSSGSITATPSTATPAANANYTVALSPSVDGYWITGNGASVAGESASSVTMRAPAAAGVYTYTVYIRNGGAAQTTYRITVAGAPVQVTTTTALAMAPTSATAVAPAAKTLTATVTGAGAAGTVQFFNGTTSLGTNPVAAGTASRSLTAIAAGSYSYRAVFTPTNAALFTSSTSGNTAFTVTVSVPVPVAPTASFTASVATGIAPLPVTLTDTSIGAPTSWAWTFGNGTSSALQSPSVTYTTAGTYTVTLIASNATGTSAAATQVITVTTPPIVTPSTAKISRLSPNDGERGDRVTIYGSGFGQAGVVKFGTVTATVSSWSATRIQVRVPREGRSSRVSVTVTPANGTASNALSFRYDDHDDDDHDDHDDDD